MSDQPITPGGLVCWAHGDALQIGVVEAVYRDGNLRLRPLDKAHRTIAKPPAELRLLWTLEQLRSAAAEAIP